MRLPPVRALATVRAVGWLAAATLVVRCADPASPPTSIAPNLAKPGVGGTTSATVTSTNPSYGRRGTIGQRVTITGSGFDVGSTAAWQRSGEVDARIRVYDVAFVSSSRLDVTLDIAADAELAFYDVVVTTAKGTKGIGTESYEVTNATAIGTLGGNTLARGANDSIGGWRVVGYSVSGNVQHAFVWGAPYGMRSLGPGSAWDIDAAGLTVVGRIAGGSAATWTNTGGDSPWMMQRLPVGSGSLGSDALGLASDAAGVAFLIAGNDMLPAQGFRNGRTMPRLWRRDASDAWQIVALAMPKPDADAWSWAADVNVRGQAVGAVRVGNGGAQAVFWDSLGVADLLTGGITADAINADGTIVVGQTDRAVYWTATIDANGKRAWAGPTALPGTCGRATGIDDSNRIVATGCSNGTRGNVPAVFVPPYDAVEPLYLGGLGVKSEAGVAEAISPRGTTIAGNGPSTSTGSIRIGAIWTVFGP